jgi:UV DNA damage endonuclease
MKKIYNLPLPAFLEKIGYACINTQLSDKGITTNRGCKKQTFLDKGIPYVSKLALQNAKDLIDILYWNELLGIKQFRISSDMFPWMSEYELTHLPDYSEIRSYLNNCGDKIKEWGHSIEMHPGPYTIIASENSSVVEKGLKELEQHAQIMDLLKLPNSHEATINIHMGTSCNGNKTKALSNFKTNFSYLSDSVKFRLALENDDKKALYTIEDLGDLCKSLNIALTLDTLHHFCHNSQSIEKSFEISKDCWNCIPLLHHSSSKKIWEDSDALLNAHAFKIWNPIPEFDTPIRIMFESKGKEISIRNWCIDLKKTIHQNTSLI